LPRTSGRKTGRERDSPTCSTTRDRSIRERPEGVLHAKAIVADNESIFITSANLTEAAFDRNIEVGVVTHDRALAASLTKHFRVLIERGLLSPLPAA
jgi:phosphatidylserine/phosphatidylglycerophosphate/cardiolipin synthase-like enzyme